MGLKRQPHKVTVFLRWSHQEQIYIMTYFLPRTSHEK